MNLNILLVACVLLEHAAAAPSVVVNKYFNAIEEDGDVVELLVVEEQLDMRGMIIKDYRGNNYQDLGGGYVFADDPLWADLPAGTLIVLYENSSAADVDASDHRLSLGLENTTYFTNADPTHDFELVTIDMVQIKSAGSGKAGVTGAIHTFGSILAAAPGTFWTSSPEPKLATTSVVQPGNFLAASNPTGTLDDYHGSALEIGSTGYIFGTGNNEMNTGFIETLASPVELSLFALE